MPNTSFVMLVARKNSYGINNMTVYYKFNLTTRILELLESFQFMCLVSDLNQWKLEGIFRFPKKRENFHLYKNIH